MKPPSEIDLGASLEQSRSGLRDGHRRSLMRVLFLITGIALTVFGVLQLLNNNGWFALGEFVASAVLLWGRSRIETTPNLNRWIYSYLMFGFFFALLILLVPDASVTAYVWILMMPVLAYLLLGKTDGLRLSLPFVIAGCVVYALYLGRIDSARVLIDLLNLVLGAVLMLSFIHVYETRREEAEKKLFDLAQNDSLTGLANRASFHSVLARTVAECHRSGGGFALVIMDLDHFKLINDTMGHDAGDHALSSIGQMLTERLRGTDYVGRLGGEEFGLILRDVKPDHSYELTEELRQRIADAEVVYGNAVIRLTASFGIAHFPEHGRTSEALYRAADRCLLAGKQAGRNTVVPAGLSAVKPAGR